MDRESGGAMPGLLNSPLGTDGLDEGRLEQHREHLGRHDEACMQCKRAEKVRDQTRWVQD